MKPRKPVIFDPETGACRVTLTREQVALIDPEDAEFISQWDWNASGHGYAVRTDRVGEQRYVRMHRALAERWGWNIAGLQIDHVNGNGFDNRRANLRPATASENSRNRGPQRNNTSGFKGVSWNKKQSRWEAKIWIDG